VKGSGAVGHSHGWVCRTRSQDEHLTTSNMNRALALTSRLFLLALTMPQTTGAGRPALVAALIAALSAGPALAEEVSPLKLVQTIPLPNVEGRIDHLAVDLKGQRLFVAALGNNTVEVIDLRSGTRVRSLTGLHEPQDVAFIEDLAKLFVSNGGSGALNIFDGSSLEVIGAVKFPDDADNMRLDATGSQLYVGYGDGALAIMDVKDGKQVGVVKLAAHPESFQLETVGNRIFVNVPNANQIAVIDRRQRRVLTTWALRAACANFPMALDEAHHRLFVGCRQPAKLLAFDTESGKVVASLDCAGDPDDLFYDRERRRLYVSAGAGAINVFLQRDAGHYELIAKLPTAAGARTALLVPQFSRFYLAVPHRGAQRAEVRVYDVQ
jgi:DNA-binding beta-propeller fold protein YncE